MNTSILTCKLSYMVVNTYNDYHINITSILHYLWAWSKQSIILIHLNSSLSNKIKGSHKTFDFYSPIVRFETILTVK